ncbi:hypothetical protein BJ138DRAFT_1146532 [Hygrophoropsis aurantiaca]|uniref:Uncharacterized protein n=1 Tax=Hygrophoropsis aurantiaca TaxID=72124 RepID=A0ACB8AL37_9AGAM|nr:hypothetical protein BJ138DRAFT_1146532 [Hygrophoropsis aurantiaca]
MANGPPPSQAGPSHSSSFVPPPPTTANTSDPTSTQRAPPYYAPVQINAQSQPAGSVQYTQTQAQAGQNTTQGYYAMNYPPGTWQNWQVTGYPYASGNTPYQQQHPYSQVPYAQYQSQQYAVQYQPQAKQRPKLPQAPPPKARTPSPSPPPQEFHRHWDDVIKAFLKNVGLTQALRGFEDDMIVMNSEWERRKVPGAIGDLMKDLLNLGKSENGEEIQERPLEERKLDYVRIKGGEPRSQTSVVKSISAFLARNRARNDASNRTEFLESRAQKRQRLQIDDDSTDPIPSCARTDAKPLDRDVQMKYDIAKNEDGPLRRTMKGMDEDSQPQARPSISEDSLSEEQPAVDERVKHIEAHLAVHYVPGPPRTLIDRLKFLEDHIVHLEKEYPPWAALHFNQPNRSWPSPPRPTPIIIPSHMTSKALPDDTSIPGSNANLGGPDEPVKGKNKNKSSLHRAVVEKLEVQKAMADLASRSKIT